MSRTTAGQATDGEPMAGRPDRATPMRATPRAAGEGGGARLFVALGSNLDSRFGSPAATVAAAARELDRMAGVRLVAMSSVYRTDPLGGDAQPDYANAVAELAVDLGADRRAGLERLLALCLALETRFGRQRGAERWQPRTLDVDLLCSRDGTVVASAALTLPHPRLAERRFVLVPLVELAPEVEPLGDGRSAAGLLAALPQDDSVRPWPTGATAGAV